jgi:hypothetical protein
MAVRVACQDRVERRHPRVEIDVELAAERLVATERRRRDLREDWPSGAADQVRRGRPSNDLPARRVAPPSHLPLADVLDAVRCCPGADDVVADGRAEAGRRIGRTLRFDRGDEELRRGDVADIVDQPPQFRAKRTSIERGIVRQILRPLHIERRLTRLSGFDRDQPCAAETRIEQSVGDVGGAVPSPTNRIGQLAEPRVELGCLTLQREPIVPWFELFQKRLHRFRNRELGSIVGLLLNPRCFTKNGTRRQEACDEEPLRPGYAMRLHRAMPARGTLAESESLRRWRRSLGSCFQAQRRPPGMRTSMSTGPA